jgi:hypothetical protein
VAIWVAIQGSTLFCRAVTGQLKKIAVQIRATAGQLHFSRIDIRGGDGVSAETLLSHHIWTFILLARSSVRVNSMIRGTLNG